jgi:hypothetical protein
MSRERTANEHDWASQRLELLALGLLKADEDTQARDHVSGCSECREQLTGLKVAISEWAAGGHVPASMLARWPAIANALTDVEQREVWRHLSECGECQQDLLLATQARPATRSRVRPLAERWGFAAIGAAATWLLLWSLGRAPLPQTPTPMRSNDLSMSFIVDAPTLNETLRGNADHGVTQLNPAGADPIAVTLPPFDTPDSAAVRFEIVNPAGAVVGRLAQIDARSRHGGVLMLGDAHSALPDGEYELRIITLTRDLRPDTTSLQFIVLRKP